LREGGGGLHVYVCVSVCVDADGRACMRVDAKSRCLASLCAHDHARFMTNCLNTSKVGRKL